MKTFLLNIAVYAAIGAVVYGFTQLPKDLQNVVGFILQAPFAIGAMVYLWDVVCHPLDAMRDSVNNRGDGGGV